MTHASSLVTAAVAGTLVLIVPIATQLLLWPDLADMPAGYLIFSLSQLLGWLLFATVCVRTGSLHTEAGMTRAGRIGRGVTLAGCLLQVAFSLLYGVSSLITGEPFEGSFWLFLLGFVALFAGGITWGMVLRRRQHLVLAGNGFLAMGVLGVLAIVVGDNWMHDVTLFAGYAAWIVIGFGAARAVSTSGRQSPSLVSQPHR